MAKANTNPEVRFAGFSEDWVPSKLGNIGEVKMCKRIFNNQTSPKGDIPFYKIGTFGKKADSYISKELYQEFRNKYPFPKGGDILISASGTLGRIVVYDGKPAYFQDSNIVWLNHNESKILNEFLYYIYGNITYESEGGTIQRLYNSIILNARFSFPENRVEQKLIGNFLSNIDKLISNHHQKHTKLKSLKHAMLDKMFPKQGQLVPEIRFKGFTDNWIQSDLKNILSFQYGIFNNNPNNGGEYPVYGANGVIGGYSEYNASDSVVIGHMGEYAGIVLWADGKHFVTYNGIITKPKNEELLPKFSYFLLFKMNLRKICDGSGQPFLSYTILNSITGIYPKSHEEQNKISKYFENLDKLIKSHELQIAKMASIKNAFMAKMFL